jgi:nitrosocyanin
LHKRKAIEAKEESKMRCIIFFIITSAMIFSFSSRVYSEVTHVHHEATVGQEASELEEIEDVGNTICPVMGGKVDKNISYTYEGRRYYFCCPMCIEEFKKNPEKYIKKTEGVHSVLSGELEDDVRVVEVKAFKYGFHPDPIVVRQGEKVRLKVTSSDVTHGLAIKDFGVSVSAPVGRINVVEFIADKAGNFYILCSVYCGPGHSKMHGTLKVVE